MKSLLCTLLVSFASLISSQAAFDIFIKFGETSPNAIDVGDSKSEAYSGNQGWFKLTTYSFGIKNTVDIGSAPGVGRASFEEIVITKKAGVGSADLFLACAKGDHFDKVTIVMVRSGVSGGPSPARILQMELHHVLVQSVKAAGADGDDAVNEVLTIKHGAHQLEFFKEDTQGGVESAGKTIWSVVNNNESTST